MYDAVLHFHAAANTKSKILCELGLDPGAYHLATLHRPYNTDEPARLAAILDGFVRLEEKVVFPIHPRTRKRIAELLPGHALAGNVLLVEPVGYLDMLVLERNARTIITDSGGVQKEAFFFSVPCVTMRPETEWTETIESGWNVLVRADSDQIVSAVKHRERPQGHPPALFGDGSASERIVETLTNGSYPKSVMALEAF
jgi:UDP-N-acetylglucosamine 2-epimerase